MASQDARLSKFEADFKQQQSKMTDKINTVLKAITNRLTGALPSDTVKNPKLNVNSTSPIFSTRSYLMEDPQCPSHPPNSINAIKTCSKETNHSKKDQLQTVMKIGTQQPEEHERTLKDEFQDFHLNLPVLEVLAHAPIYNAILYKYVESLELGKNGFAFIQGEMPKRMEDPGLFTLPCRLWDSKPFDTLADLGSCVNIIHLYLFKKLKIRLLEETDHVFGLADEAKSYPIRIVRDKGNQNFHIPGNGKIARDAEINPFKDVLVFRRMVEFLGALPINLKRNIWESKDLIENPINWDKPPKSRDGAWHAKIRIFDSDGEEFI
ncbi:hypothetical protein Tco_0424129 [Tanacetum coccineum]